MGSIAMMLIGLAIGIALLGWAANRFIDASVALASLIQLPPLLIGMVLVGFGTSFPEVVVSALAAIHHNPTLAVGNVIGSNIANIGMCLGITAVAFPLAVHSRILKREYVILCLATLYIGLFVWAGILNRFAGIALLLMLVIYLWWIFKSTLIKQGGDDALAHEFENEIPRDVTRPIVTIGWWVFSLVLIFASSEILIRSAIALAQWLQVSDLLIGLTVVAIGTSLPELAATIIAAKRGEHDIAIGNVIGSCIFNLLAVLSMPALIAPSRLPSEILYRDYPVMLGFTLLFGVLTILPPQKGCIGRLSGVLLIVLFVGYLSLLVVFSQ